MFDNDHYVTRGVSTLVPLETQMFLWGLVKHKEDYLQVFKLTCVGGQQHIIHTQENPTYKAEYDILTKHPICAKIYVIDDEDHSTMLLAEEY